MKKLMTWSLIVASFGLTGCKSLQDYMNDLKHDDKKTVTAPKSADKVDEKKAASSASAKSVSPTQASQAKKVGYGYSKQEAPADNHANPKKKQDPKAENEAAVTPASQKAANQRSFQKVDDAPVADSSKQPIGPGGIKPKPKDKDVAQPTSVLYKGAKLKKVDAASAASSEQSEEDKIKTNQATAKETVGEAEADE